MATVASNEQWRAMESPTLVIVSGAPAVGKTTLSRRLAQELRLPLIAKDNIKELLGAALGAPDLDASKRLGAATYTLLYAFAGWLLDAGVGLVLESNFWHGASEVHLAPLVARARAVLVHCEAAPEVILRRYAERAMQGERHPVHFSDADDLPRLREVMAEGRFDPLDLDLPMIRVQTDDGYAPGFARVLALIRAATTPG
jgi:predicted kinase